ncbi:MAG: SMP-30/gluconolactonase/LRE family protein, partial [Chloroflexota bacterium]
KFTEGPVWHPIERTITFSDITGNSLFQYHRAHGLTDIRPNSHMANGNTYDTEWRLLTCHHATSRVTRTEHDGTVTVLASAYEGKQLNSPNDIVCKRDGAVYFTDPTSGREAFVGVPRSPDLDFSGVYRWDPETEDITLLVADFAKPNGLCFDREEMRLFINDTVRFHIRVFDVESDGSISNGRLWVETTGEGVGVPDGMKVDSAGNVWCCAQGGVHVFAPDATCLGVLRIPEHATNFCWGDDDLQTLYITASTRLYRVRVKVPGRLAFG